MVAMPPRAIWRCRTYLPTIADCAFRSADSRIPAFCSFIARLSFEELDLGPGIPEVHVLELAIGRDEGAPHRVRVLMVVLGKARRSADTEAQIGQLLERVHECIRVERPPVCLEACDEHTRGHVPLERGKRRSVP